MAETLIADADYYANADGEIDADGGFVVAKKGRPVPYEWQDRVKKATKKAKTPANKQAKTPANKSSD